MEEKDIKPENAKKRSSNIDEMTPEQLRDEVRDMRRILHISDCFIKTQDAILKSLDKKLINKNEEIKNLKLKIDFDRIDNDSFARINRDMKIRSEKLRFERNFLLGLSVVMTVAFIIRCIVAACH